MKLIQSLWRIGGGSLWASFGHAYLGESTGSVFLRAHMLIHHFGSELHQIMWWGVLQGAP